LVHRPLVGGRRCGNRRQPLDPHVLELKPARAGSLPKITDSTPGLSSEAGGFLLEPAIGGRAAISPDPLLVFDPQPLLALEEPPAKALFLTAISSGSRLFLGIVRSALLPHQLMLMLLHGKAPGVEPGSRAGQQGGGRNRSDDAKIHVLLLPRRLSYARARSSLPSQSDA
jgi:hypothetical protein